jgi:Tfp pilus assembly protein PilX
MRTKSDDFLAKTVEERDSAMFLKECAEAALRKLEMELNVANETLIEAAKMNFSNAVLIARLRDAIRMQERNNNGELDGDIPFEDAP